MEYSGKIIEVGALKGGTSKAGKEWSVQEYVMLDSSSQREKCISFEVFGSERIKSFDIQLGDNVTVTLDVESRKWMDRWYPSVRCVKCEKEKVAEAPEEEEVQAVKAEPAPEKTIEQADDLPF